jgi:YesN/AraC family two-component response regulator
MDGLQVVQKLKSTFATDHIPIIMLTAKVSFDSMVDGLSVGADDYLSKPFKSQELLLRVANLIKRQEKLRAKYQEQDKDEPLKTSVKDPLIQKIEALILSDVSVQPTVDDLAQACALSRSQLHRKIKFITGLSTTALLTDIRLTQSKIDLKTTQLSISEIAYKFGYSDPAHYSKLFKKQFNETPSDYRSSFK